MVIRKLKNGKYALYSLHSGKRLGIYNSKEAAIVRENQIQYFKHRRLS